jgi:NIMA (never in mitosis gene a)-related kinase
MNKKSIKNKSDNSKYIGNYQIIKKIGEGSYAKIYKVKKDNSDTLYVLKNIPVSEEDYSSMNEILNESSILSNCDNIYIIKYYDSFFYNGTFNIITEFCPYGDLFGYIKFYKVRGSRIEEKIIWIIFIQLSLGLCYLHSKKILHRDIKTKNIFIKNNLTVKIGDFGIAKILSSTSSYAHTFIGTPYYISPELCKDQPYNDKSDVWALGCVLYELCTLNHPFEGGTQVEIYEKIVTQKFKSINPEYSSDLKKMIDLLLEKDENKRPKMKDILKMKSVIDKANKYNIELDIFDTIEEEKILK